MTFMTCVRIAEDLLRVDTGRSHPLHPRNPSLSQELARMQDHPVQKVNDYAVQVEELEQRKLKASASVQEVCGEA